MGDILENRFEKMGAILECQITNLGRAEEFLVHLDAIDSA